MSSNTIQKSSKSRLINFLLMFTGAFFAALSIQMFLSPNDLIDGGIIGLALMCSRLTNEAYLPLFTVIFNLPFVYLAYKHIRRSFVIQMTIAISLFSAFLFLFENIPSFKGDTVEVIVLGGAVLGLGVGLMIRGGGCTDGTEILGIIINKKKGFTVGQVVLFFNFFVFALYGWIFLDWHIALKSLLTYVVAFKVIDGVLAGLEEIKSVMIITKKPKEVSKAITGELGLGLTAMYGRGGFSGDAQEILLVIVERLDLADLKEIVTREDDNAFIAIQNISEAIYSKPPRKKKNGRIATA